MSNSGRDEFLSLLPSEETRTVRHSKSNQTFCMCDECLNKAQTQSSGFIFNTNNDDDVLYNFENSGDNLFKIGKISKSKEINRKTKPRRKKRIYHFSFFKLLGGVDPIKLRGVNYKNYCIEKKRFMKNPFSCDDVLLFSAKYSALSEVEKWFTTVDLKLLEEIFDDNHIDGEIIKYRFDRMHGSMLDLYSEGLSDLPSRAYISIDARHFEDIRIAGQFHVLKSLFKWDYKTVRKAFVNKKFLGFFIYKNILYFDTEYVSQLRKFIEETQSMLLKTVDNKFKMLKIVNEKFVISLENVGMMIKNFTEKASYQLDDMQKRVSSMEKTLEETRLEFKERTRAYIDKEFGKFMKEQKKKGEEYIKSYENKLRDKIPEYDGYVKLEKKVKKLYEETFCRICNMSSVNTVLDCGHMFCSQCAMSFRESEENENKEIYPFGRCPICRTRIGVFIAMIK
jgi:hypothetical protein